jgi:serine/threonine protein kinase
VIDKTISHYKILEKIGEGGMGEVYLAQDTQLDRQVVLKFLSTHLTPDAESKERFKREAKAAASLNHPNIITIHEFGEVEGQSYICMEYVEGQSLKELITKSDIEIDTVLDISTQICKGLNEAHKAGIVHRDLKPENILIDKNGIVKILDFGLAKLKGATLLTKETSTLGTLFYMSPEQYQKADVDHRTDIWSFGVILYEMLSGQLPFTGEYEAGVMYSVLNEEPESITGLRSDFPLELEQIVKKAMAKDIKERYQTIDDLIIDLRKEEKVSINHAKVKLNKKLIFIAAILTTVIIASILFFLKYYLQIKKHPEDIVLKDTPSIAVMYFEDNTGDEAAKWLSRGLPHMLITSLEQIPELHVIGYQRLYDLLKELGKEDIESIDKTSATEIAQKAGVKTMLLGSIFKWGNQFRVDYQLQSVKQGSLLYADKVEGDDPFKLADTLALQVRQNLEVPTSLQTVLSITEVTTHSLEVYRYYLKGKDLLNKGYWKDSWDNYSMAIRLDSTFAMVYLDMFYPIGGNVGLTQAERESFLEKAVKHSNKASERERLTILAKDAYYHGKLQKFRQISEKLLLKYPTFAEFYEQLGDYHLFRREYEASTIYYKKWVELSNYSPHPFLNVYYTFEMSGQRDSALSYFNKFKELYPNDPTVFQIEGENYMMNGEMNKALDLFYQLVIIIPEDPWAHMVMGRGYFFAGLFEDAQTEFLKVDSLGWELGAIKQLAILKIYQGKYKNTLKFLKKNESNRPQIAYRIKNVERILYDLHSQNRNAKKIWQEYKQYVHEQLSPKRKGDTFFADSLLNLAILNAYYDGNISEALKLCDRLEDEIILKDLGNGYKLNLAISRSKIFYNERKFVEAEKEFTYIVAEEPKIIHLYRLSNCFYQRKKYRKAKTILLKVNKTYEPMFGMGWLDIDFGYAYPRTFYLLGLVNEALGEQAEAVKAYQRFLEIWKEADENLPELIEAKQRLAKLKDVFK